MIVAIIARFLSQRLRSINAKHDLANRKSITPKGGKITVSNMHEIASFLRRKCEKMHPVNAEQIKAIEEENRVVLPNVYKEFLSLMGKGAGGYMLGSSAFYPAVMHLQFGAEELMKENSLPPLPPKSFTCWMHQGYCIAYFITDDGDDPPVYFYSEGFEDNGFRLMTNSLTDFFLYQLKRSYSEDEFELPHMPLMDWKS